MTRKTKTVMTSTTTTTPALPKGVLKSDLKWPKYREGGPKVIEHLDLYYVTSFGWCIATLHIRNPGRRSARNATARTYAVRIDDGAMVRIGLGPHVLTTAHVYVTDKRQGALQAYIDLKHTGEVKANETRDRISTRRAQSTLRRAERDPADILNRFMFGR